MDRLGVCATASQNVKRFLHAVRKHQDVNSFLRNTDYIPLHSTNLDDLEREVLLETTYDIDGVVIELSRLEGINLPIRNVHLDLKRNLITVYHKLKKHYRLQCFSAVWLNAFKLCRGLVFARHGGYELVISLLPCADVTATQARNCKRDDADLQYFSQLKEKAEFVMMNCSESEKARPTIQKNCLSNMDFWDVLNRDRAFVLLTLDEAFAQVEPPSGFRLVTFCSQFGQKEVESIDLEDITRIENVMSLSVHAAVNLSLGLDNINWFWAREGLRHLLRSRGRAFPVLTFSETCNFQTNLDGHPLDISKELQAVAAKPDRLSFLQLYADLPHRHVSGIRPHPVCGAIVTAGLLHPQTTRKLYRDADAYLSTAKDNISKIGPLSHGRLEMVTSLPGDELDGGLLTAENFISERHLLHLLEAYPLVLPFRNSVDVLNSPMCFMKTLQAVGMKLVYELQSLFDNNKGKGGFKASWSALQLELALDKFMHGQYFLGTDRMLAINLGPGSDEKEGERSATSARGFLTFEPYNNCAADESSPPPLTLWTKSVVEQQRIKRAFAFADLLDSSHAVMGNQLLICVLADLRKGDMSELELLGALKGMHRPAWGKLVGAIGINQLADQLDGQIPRMKYPCVSQKLAGHIKAKKLHLPNVVKAGLQMGDYKYFVCPKIYEGDRHVSISWNGKDLLQVVPEGGAPNMEAKAEEMSGNVISFLQTEGFAFQTTLKPLREAPELPWMRPTLVKLEGNTIREETLLQVCALVTGIAMMSNGIFVQYDKMKKLMGDIGIWNTHLQRLEVLSSFAHSNMPLLHRLHPSIPWKLPSPLPRSATRITSVSHEQEQTEGETEVDTEEVLRMTSARHIPTSMDYLRWQPDELDILKEIDQTRPRNEQYNAYATMCRERDVPHRNNKAFQRKMSRL